MDEITKTQMTFMRFSLAIRIAETFLMSAAELASCLIHTQIKSNQSVRSYERIWVRFRKAMDIEMRLWLYVLL